MTRSRRYPEETLIDADYADELELLANIPPQAEFPLQASGGIGFLVNIIKTEFTWFKQKGAISTC